MKTISVYLTITILFLNICIGNAYFRAKEDLSISKRPFESLKSNQQYDTLLHNIQQKVMKAFVDAKINQSDNGLVLLEKELSNLAAANKNNMIVYWYSYACYYHSILFFTINDKKKSEKVLEDGIEKLKAVEVKNSEHLALLSLMEGFSIQYASGMDIPSISQDAKQNATKASQLDSLNLRAFYVLASNDFYTPAQYGGGKKTETYLKKAISLKEQSVQNAYLPSWGRNSAYEMLIRFYISRQQYGEAKKYYQEAIALFPDDYMINKLAAELVNH